MTKKRCFLWVTSCFHHFWVTVLMPTPPKNTPFLTSKVHLGDYFDAMSALVTQKYSVHYRPRASGANWT